MNKQTKQNAVSKNSNPRLAAVYALVRVIQNGESLSQVLPNVLSQMTDKRDRGFAQHLIYGTLRNFQYLGAIGRQLLNKPLREKDQDINYLLYTALYQILHLDVPHHAAVSEAVNLSVKLKKDWAKGVLNGSLRRFLREKDQILSQLPNYPDVNFSHPKWLVNQFKNAYPNEFTQIMQENNSEPKIFLRVNKMLQTRDEFLAKLAAEGFEASAHPLNEIGVVLEQNADISALPTYEAGGFSVQDIAAQFAGIILNPAPNSRVLDACAAPGGKTTHLLEVANNQLDLLALEIDPNRIDRLEENLERLNLNASVQVGDASNQIWFEGEKFDKILLDAPCSATGIIRRQPDIKFHRTEEDIAELNRTQAKILANLWQVLKPGGQLLYATCSILPSENKTQIKKFLEKTPDAKLTELNLPKELACSQAGEIGCQILPGEFGMDGFYYALLTKQA